MRWYCRFCRMFKEVDKNLVCNYCQDSKKVFNYIDVDDDTRIEESVEVDMFGED